MQTTLTNINHVRTRASEDAARSLTGPAASQTALRVQALGRAIAAFVAGEWDMIFGVALIAACGAFAVVQVTNFVR